ncbi:MAG: lytic murein transglycosylase [Actinomycetes bacterium]
MTRFARLATVATAAIVAAVPLAATAPTAAHADSAAAAEARAKKLLAQVAAIQKQVDGALANYDNALTGLAGAVGSNVAADTALGTATQDEQSANDHNAATIRAIYRAGGEYALYSTVLQGSDPADLLNRMQIVRRMVASDQRALTASRDSLHHAASVAVAARRIANGRAHAAAHVDAVAQKLQSLLAQEQVLLTQAKAESARLRTAEQALAAARASYGAITEQRIRSIQPLAMSATFAKLYHDAAATCPGLSWTVLAAIGQVETGHGRNTNMSSAGAEGPMQFLPSTFARYAVDGDHNGTTDILDPADAIYTAAHYLCSNGAGLGGNHLANAIWHYNHAGWYVELVLTLSQRY